MRLVTIVGLVCLMAAISACGRSTGARLAEGTYNPDLVGGNPRDIEQPGDSTIWDVFGPDTTEVTLSVNKYLWAASLDVLNFLPVQTVDPFTGVIVTGFGTPPGGGRAYRATIHITDPALDARALRVSMQTRNGPVSSATSRAVEDAILSRARQMRIADNNL
ncbi:MAG: DUF3576 domain-containing protein [Pseudomonadota bacterium]